VSGIPRRWETIEGAPFPLGATWVESEQAFNFALYSKHAERVTLVLYGANDLARPLVSRTLHPRIDKSGRIWHCRLRREEMGGARYYAYRVWGPAGPDHPGWHAFDGNKILLDPFARAVFFPPRFDRAAACGRGSNAGQAPLGILAAHDEPFDWGHDRAPRHDSDLVIYELHVRGFTANPNSGVGEGVRGTYLGVVEKIPYLKELGITAVELMPVFQFDPQEGNYWGYMPLSFFAPHQGYACGGRGAHHEFRTMVKALHEANIEVILDVVYNHTAEGDHRHPVYSFKGIDAETYYLMTGDPRAPFANYSGCGNTLRAASRAVRHLIRESLRYWVTEMHVDGFRFDLAAVASRGPDGSVDAEDPPLFGDLTIPELAGVRLIAEPWDAGGLYQLGSRFPGLRMRQWNGRFRDDVRRFARGDASMVGALMSRLYGSDDLFPDGPVDVYQPFQSVNYVTAHDGFTLHDLVTYGQRRNWANGHANTDGPAEEYGWNCGWEGDEGAPPEVTALRRRQVKNLACLLFLANGTPMLRAGDEFLQTQGGNNNPYNQDNATSWLDWDRLRAHRDVFRFVRGLIAFRKAHPSLCRSRFWHDDVRWYGVGPAVDLAHDSHSVAFCLHGASAAEGDLYVMISAYWEPLTFTIQEGAPGTWRRVIDTARESPDDLREPGTEAALGSLTYPVAPRSVVVLIRR
jgi:glycogen operon protein